MVTYSPKFPSPTPIVHQFTNVFPTRMLRYTVYNNLVPLNFIHQLFKTAISVCTAKYMTANISGFKIISYKTDLYDEAEQALHLMNE